VLRRACFRDPDAADRCRGAIEGQGLCQGEALGGGKDVTPSTPAVRLPRLSWVTWRTARSLADQECRRRRWSLRTVRTSCRRLARSMRFCRVNTCRGIRAQGRGFQPDIDRGIVSIACLLRFVPLPSTVPGLRQPILWLSQRRWLLRPSPTGLACGGHLLPGSVGGLGGGRARQAGRRSWKLFGVVCRVALCAGVLRDALWITGLRVQPCPRPLWAKPIIHGGLLFITTIPSCVRVPTPAQLCSAGCAGGFRGTAFHARFTTLMVSRSRGACASSWHRGERNGTSTAAKLSQTLRSRPLIPGFAAIARERIAETP
jgi:hypothetical protein